MRKISLVLVALMGLSGVAYGADWVEIGHGGGFTLSIAPAQPRDSVWEKLVFSRPQEKFGQYFNKIVSLTKFDCTAGWTQQLQLYVYMDEKILRGGNLHMGKEYAAPNTNASVLLGAVCRK